MATVSVRSRRSSGPGTGQWLALGAAAILILSLTFALGVLIGRQWARQMPPGAAADPAKKTASAARRNGLAEAGMERPPELGEKLTFYQTLTAPLHPGSAAGKGGPAQRPEAAPRPPAEAVSAPAPAPPVDEAPPGVVERAPEPVSPPAPPPAPERAQEKAKPEVPEQWTVQAGAFKARAQAERLQKQLASAGFTAYVTEKGGEGPAQFRVRVGSFKTREEAARVAERVKAERSLAAFVTTK
jgi:cell division protein FtsN